MADLLPDHDESEGDLPNPLPRRRGRWWKMGCGGILAIMLVFIVGWLVWRNGKLSAIAQLEAEIRARGEPVNAEELNARYRDLQDAKDKTALFVALTPRVTEQSFVDSLTELPYVGEGYLEIPTDPEEPFETEEAVRQFLAENSELMQAIEEAGLAEGDVRFPHDFRQAYMMLLPHTQATRTIVRLLDLQARFAARQGDTEKAFRSIQAMFGVGEALNHEPIVISQLMRQAIRQTVQNTICDILPLADFSDEQLRQLIAECGMVDWRQTARMALIGERAFGRVEFVNPQILESEFQLELSWILVITSSEDERFFIERMNEQLNATDEEFPEMIASFERLEAQFDRTTLTEAFIRPISSLVQPNFLVAAKAFARGEVCNRATAAQLACELCRRKHGQPPATLADLVPEFLPKIPLDTFTGEPLIYRVDEDEIVIYSVGRNGIDDGGSDELNEERDVLLDVTTRVKRE